MTDKKNVWTELASLLSQKQKNDILQSLEEDRKKKSMNKLMRALRGR